MVKADGGVVEEIVVSPTPENSPSHRISASGCAGGWMGISVAQPDGSGGYSSYAQQLRKVDRMVAGVGTGTVGRVVNAPPVEHPVSGMAEVLISDTSGESEAAVVWQSISRDDEEHELFIGYGDPDAGDLAWQETSRLPGDPLRLKAKVNARGEALDGYRLWRNAEWKSLDQLAAVKGWAELEGIDINDSGWILATGRRTDENGVPVGEREGVLLVAVEFEFVEVDGDGLPTGVEGMPSVSMPSPVIAVNAMEVTSDFDVDGNPVGALTMDVTVTSEACDRIKGEALGAVKELQVFVNGADEAFTTVALTVGKTEDTATRALARYPYTGSFTGGVTSDLPLVEGTNTIELRAVEPSSGLAGVAWSSFDLHIDRPDDGGGAVVPPGGTPPPGAVSLVSIRLSADGLPQDDHLDTMMFTLVWDDASEVDYMLTEDSVDGNVFASPNDVVTAVWDAESGVATVNASTLGLSGIDFALRVDAGHQLANLSNEGGAGSGPVAADINVGEISEDGTIYQDQVVQDGATEGGFVRSQFVRVTGLVFLPGSLLENDIRFAFRPPNAQEGQVTTGNLMILRDAQSGVDWLVTEEEFELERPTALFFTTPLEENTVPSDAEIEKQLNAELAKLGESLGDAWDFKQGFNAGVNAGAKDMIVGTGEVIYSGLDYVAGRMVASLTMFWSGVQASAGNTERSLELYQEAKWTEQENAQTEEKWKEMADSAMALADATWNYGEDFAVLMFAGLSEEEDLAFEEADRLGETNQLIQLIGGELLGYAATELEEATSHERGYFMGRVCFELMMEIGPMAAAGKADKVKVLEKLDAMGTPADLKGAKAGIYAGLLNRARVLIAKLLHTQQCFVAGTPVLARLCSESYGGSPHRDASSGDDQLVAGWVPIESVTPGMEVWARDEATGRMGWRRVVRTEQTSTDEVVVVGIDGDGDGAVDEEIRGTSIHPFFVAGSGWVEMSELSVGDVLIDAEGSHSLRVASVTRERAPPGEWIATYNFDVEGWQSYHVGTLGAWVHNGTKLRSCLEFAAIFERMRALPSAADETPADTLYRMQRFLTEFNGRKPMFGRKFSGDVWGRGTAHTTQDMLDGYALGKYDLDDMPTAEWWDTLFYGKTKKGMMDMHHSVERYIQEILEIPAEFREKCPGVMLPRNLKALNNLNDAMPAGNQLKAIHKGMEEGGISGILQSRIKKGNPDGLSKQDILDELFEIYDDDNNINLRNQWPPARDWLLKLQSDGVWGDDLEIPDFD